MTPWGEPQSPSTWCYQCLKLWPHSSPASYLHQTGRTRHHLVPRRTHRCPIHPSWDITPWSKGMSADPPLSPALPTCMAAPRLSSLQGPAALLGLRAEHGRVWSARAAHLAGTPLHPGCSYLWVGKSSPTGVFALAPRGDQAAKQKHQVNGGQTTLSCHANPS